MTTPTEPSIDDAAPPLAEVRGVSFSYRGGLDVVCDLNLRLYAGKVLCLLGDSGCGKSTLLRLLAGLERPSKGSILIDNEVVSAADGQARHRKPEHRAVGYVFQDYALFPHLSVLKNITFGMPKGPKSERNAAAIELLDRVGLADYANTMPHTLSGGQQQRVALARALARRPKLMLLDEPFTSLDTTLRDELRKVTLNVLRETCVATLMVTHDPAEALMIADDVSVMRGGRLVMQGSPDDCLSIEPRLKGPPIVRVRSMRDQQQQK